MRDFFEFKVNQAELIIVLRTSIVIMDSNLGISSRAQKFLKSGMPYLGKALEAIFNQYSPENPTGPIPLVIAENKLCSDMLLEHFRGFHDYSADVLNYTDTTGMPVSKLALATFLSSNVFGGFPVSPQDLVLSSGCTGLLYGLSVLLFEIGDSVLIPAPYYAAFDPDFLSIGGVTTVPVWPVGEPSFTGTSSEASKWILNNLTEESLEEAYTRSLKANHTPKALLIVNPGNPTGVVYTDDQLMIAVNFTRKHNMHLIVDEIYALSVYDSPIPFKSIVTLLENELGSHVHVLWGLSKDFGASGFRVGAMYSRNNHLLTAFSNLNLGFQVSNVVQQMMAHMLNDTIFVDKFLTKNRVELKRSYDIVHTHLSPLGITIISPAGASIFCFADFRILLTENTFQGERELFNLMADKGVVLTPGESCHCQIPGFFRICFAYVPVDSLLEAMKRIKEMADILLISTPIDLTSLKIEI